MPKLYSFLVSIPELQVVSQFPEDIPSDVIQDGLQLLSSHASKNLLAYSSFTFPQEHFAFRADHSLGKPHLHLIYSEFASPKLLPSFEMNAIPIPCLRIDGEDFSLKGYNKAALEFFPSFEMAPNASVFPFNPSYFHESLPFILAQARQFGSFQTEVEVYSTGHISGTIALLFSYNPSDNTFILAFQQAFKKPAFIESQEVIYMMGKTLDHSKDLVVCIDKNYRITYFNKRLADLVRNGFQKELALGTYVLDILRPTEWEQYLEIYASVFAEGKQRDMQRRHLFSNGTVSVLEETFTPLLNENNLPYGIIIYARDVTDNVLIREQLQEKNLHLQNFISSIDDVLIEFTEYGDIVNVWSSKEDLLLFPKHLLVNKNITDIVDADLAQKLLHKTNIVNVFNKSEYVEFQLPQAPKHWFSLKIMKIERNRHDDRQLFMGAISTITNRKRIELEIQKSEALLRATLNHGSQHIILINKSLEIVFFDQKAFSRARRMFGVEMAAGQKIESCFWEIEQEELEKNSRLAFEGEISQNEYWVNKNGLNCWIEATFAPVADPLNGIYAVLLSYVDISARKLAEEERQKLNLALEKQNKDLRNFAYITSHNLRAPVANMLGIMSLFDKSDIADAFNHSLLENLEFTILSLDATIKDLNEILALKEQQESCENISLLELLNAIQASLYQQIKDADAKIHIDIQDKPSLLSVRSYVQSILLNLITNALKYRDPSRSAELSIKVYAKDQFTFIEVQDNGLGIDMRYNKDKIFGLYKRFHSHVDGKGMGLYMVKSQAEALGGGAVVESELGKGSIFKIWIKEGVSD